MDTHLDLCAMQMGDLVHVCEVSYMCTAVCTVLCHVCMCAYAPYDIMHTCICCHACIHKSCDNVHPQCGITCAHMCALLCSHIYMCTGDAMHATLCNVTQCNMQCYAMHICMLCDMHTHVHTCNAIHMYLCSVASHMYICAVCGVLDAGVHM